MIPSNLAKNPYEPGWVRPEVEIKFDTSGDHIEFAHWKTTLPVGYISGNTNLKDLLTGKISLPEYELNNAHDDLLTLLSAQGCFYVFQENKPCSFLEFRRCFDRLRSIWYSKYYTHPLWNRLRKGNASRNELIAWIIHNYHISRSAGIIAARMASTTTSFQLRERFIADTVEEYWHCDSYYFVHHQNLAISDEEVKSYILLPGSKAFELHALQVAQHDYLGHILIAYFQESTIHFLEDCINFYRDVEQAYNIEGFFKSWLAHMNLDLDHGHANYLSDLFNTDEEITAEQQEISLRNAWLAFKFLNDSLDQILEQTKPSQLINYSFNKNKRLTTQNIQVFIKEKVGIWPESSRISAKNNFRENFNFIRIRLIEEILRCLSYARTHDQIIEFGHFYRAATNEVNKSALFFNNSYSRWSVTICNQLAELSNKPILFSLILFSLIESWRLVTNSYLFSENTISHLHKILHKEEFYEDDYYLEIQHLLEFLQLLAKDSTSINRRDYLP